jgi:hypothetical protein
MGVHCRSFVGVVVRALILIAILLALPAIASASHKDNDNDKDQECHQFHNECVAVFNYDDGRYFVRREVVDGQVSWERIKKTPCPAENDYHYREFEFRDSKYGDWVCKYEQRHLRPIPATVGGKLGRYISTHKVLLITDAALILTSLADTMSTDHCLSIPGCKESNALVGPHPSDLEIYGPKMGLTAAIVLFDHKWVHDADHSPREHAVYLWVAPLSVLSVANTFNNVRVASHLPEARAHLMEQVPVP